MIAAGTSAAPLSAASDTKRAPSAKSASTATCGLKRESRLADPAGPGRASTNGRGGSHAGRPPIARLRSRPIVRVRNARGSATGSRERLLAWRGRRSSAGSWARIASWQFGQLGAGLDPQLLDEHLAGVLIRLQRVGLAAAAIEREHQLPVQPFAQRVLAREPLELGDQLGVTPRRARSASTRSSRAAQVLAPPAARSQPARTVLRRARRAAAAPQRERLAQLGRRLRWPPRRAPSRPGRPTRSNRVGVQLPRIAPARR